MPKILIHVQIETYYYYCHDIMINSASSAGKYFTKILLIYQHIKLYRYDL